MSKEDSCDATAPRLDGPAAGRHAERAGGRSNSADPKLASVYRLAASWAILAMPPGADGTAGCPSGQRERSVKPSAKPTMVRTHHLPPPAKTVRTLRKRGPAGRFLLVTPCISVGHCGSMYGSVYVHMVYSVRAKLAVRITARFAGPRPFCPVSRAPPRIPIGRFFAVLLVPGGGLALFVPARPGWAGCWIGPRHLIQARLRGRVCVAATGMEDQHGAVASGAVPGSGRRGEPRRHAPRVHGVPSQRLDPAEPVITCRGLVMDLSCTCRTPAPVTRSGGTWYAPRPSPLHWRPVR